MSLPGYDLRERKVRRVPYSTTGTSNSGSFQRGHAWEKIQSTISFRDSIEGKRLDPADVDPYMGFFSRENDFARYLAPDARLMTQLEAAGLAELTDYEVHGFADNGHPFTTETHEVGTSLRRPHRFFDVVGEERLASPAFVTGVRLASTTSRIFDLSADSSVSRMYQPNQPLPLSNQDELIADGKRAIVQAAPGLPEVDLTQFVAEFIQHVPAIPGRALLALRDLPSGGDEWLNLLFGVLPTVGDGIKLGQALLDITQRLQKYRKEAGQFHRRRIDYPQRVRTQIHTGTAFDDAGYIVTGSGYGFKPVHEAGFNGISTFYRYAGAPTNYSTRVTPELFMSEVREFSFSGSFTYYIPQSPEFYGRLGKYVTELDRVIGLGLDPDSLWQLAPWSWLVDWFFDIRQSLDLISINRDSNLVMNYGYAMETLKRSAVAKAKFQNGYSNRGVTYCSTYTRSMKKQRIRANPYGFISQTDTGIFDAYRLSVLSALGISRLR